MTTQAEHKRGKSPNSSALYDEWLVLMAQGGDKQVAEMLYRRWNPRLARAARRYGVGGDAAVDLAQECWAAIFKGLHDLREPARFRAFAFAVLHRRGADHIRKTLRERGAMEENATDSPDAHQSDPSERAAITQAFAQLPTDPRIAAHLYFIEGLTLREIAQAQSIPEGPFPKAHSRRPIPEGPFPKAHSRRHGQKPPFHRVQSLESCAHTRPIKEYPHG